MICSVRYPIVLRIIYPPQKSNMYQSLHTTVISKEKIPFEVQIRSWEMHYTAEYGIAAHWKYKLGFSVRISWRSVWRGAPAFIENQKDVDDARILSVQSNRSVSPDDVCVFTPKGDVITLPSATVMRFCLCYPFGYRQPHGLRQRSTGYCSH